MIRMPSVLRTAIACALIAAASGALAAPYVVKFGADQTELTIGATAVAAQLKTLRAREGKTGESVAQLLLLPVAQCYEKE